MLQMNTDTEKLKEIAAIAVPALLESLVTVAIVSLDTKMISVLGGAAISAVSLATQPRLFCLSIFFALGTAVSVFVAQAYGQRNQEEANGYFHSILKITLLLSFLLGALLWLGAEPLMRLCSRQEETVELSALFFGIVMGLMVFQTTSIVLNAALRGIGQTKFTLAANLAMGSVDVLFNYLLIEGNCGFPRLEVAGDAIATVLGTAASCLVSLAVLLRHDGFLSLRGFFAHKLFANRGQLAKIRSKGGNIIFENLFLRLGFLLSAMIVSLFPAEETAVYFVAMLLLNVSFAVGDGIQSAVVALTGRSMGSERYGDLRRYLSLSLRCGLLLSAVLGATYILGARWFFEQFFQDAQSIEQGCAFAVVAAALTGLQITRIVIVAAMRGMGEMKIPRQVATICVLFVNPVASFLLAQGFGQGVWGIWQGALISQGMWDAMCFVKMKKCLDALPTDANVASRSCVRPSQSIDVEGD